MDQTFYGYYEEELDHLRELAAEFAAIHPTVARNLQIDVTPCPDPYVERLLDGVAFLAARTRLKLDIESTRYLEQALDLLHPNLLALGPAVTTAVLRPGPQVATMLRGHVVPRGARLVAAFREGLETRAVYTTAQDVTLWPVAITAADYLPDRAALAALGLGPALLRPLGAAGERGPAVAGLRVTLAREGPGRLAELALDRLDLHLGLGSRGGALFDAIHGHATGTVARAAGSGGQAAGSGPWRPAGAPAMVGVDDGESLLPALRPAFGAFRLLREYFLYPDRFHFARIDGLGPAVRDCHAGPLEVVVLLDRPQPEVADLTAADLRLGATPIVNLFERECDPVEVDPRRAAHVLHPDRTRPLDFEVYRVLRVEDAARTGPEAELAPLHDAARRQPGAGAPAYAVERRPRRPGEGEIRRGRTRTTYVGDDAWISVAGGPAPRVLDVRALCTNRDLPLLDDGPTLLVESGDPVERVDLLAPLRPPVPGGHGRSPRRDAGGGVEDDDLAWRFIAQLSLDHLSLLDGSQDGEPLRALLALHADRGAPGTGRHVLALSRVDARRVVERLGLPGPICFGHGVEVTLTMEEGPLAGASALLLPALLARLFARHVGLNGFVRTRVRLARRQEEVAWPMMLDLRAPV